MNTVERAIEIVGTQAQLARECGVHAQAVYRWVRTGRVPAKHCLSIERATHGAVTRYGLRPDVFGAEPAQAA